MNNKNQSSPVPAQPGLNESVPSPIPQASLPSDQSGSVPPPKSKISNLKLKLPNFKNLKIPKLKFNKKSAIGIAVAIIIIIFLVVLLSLISGNGGGITPNPSFSVSPSSIPSVDPDSQSPYANDEEVRAIEERMDKFDNKINGTLLREDTLRVPTLNWKVSF